MMQAVTYSHDVSHEEKLNKQRPWIKTEMTGNLVICRICLSINVRMFSIAETPLQMVYEKILDSPLNTEQMRPISACYICYAQLKKCYKLMTMAAKSENVLKQILETYPEVSTRSAALVDHQANNLYLSTIPVEYFETSSFDTLTSNNFGQECIKLKNETEYEEENYEDLPVEAEMTEYDINKVKCESDMDEILRQNCNEAPQLDTEVKIERQDDDQDAKHLEQDEENQEIQIGSEQEFQQDSTLPSIYQCKFCLRVYTDKNSYRKHLDGHEIHECKICEKRFSNRNNLARHMSTHSEDKPYECKVCNRRFRLKHYLKRHRDIHSGRDLNKNENYKCDNCQRCFRQRSALTAHKRTHTGEKPFQCDVCQRSFASKFNLTNHVRTHSGDKPFKCDICNAQFIHRTSLKQHKLTHTGERPHRCKVCQRGFTQSSHLKDHMKSHQFASSHERD